MTKFEVFKIGVAFVVSSGTGSIAGYAINAVMPPTVKPFVKVTTFVASYFIGSMAGEKVADYAINQIDGIAKFVNNLKESLNETTNTVSEQVADMATNQEETTTEM
jgi:hypothetical protein